MRAFVRRLLFALPFGCSTALISHVVRFGDDHAFGGEANEAIVAAAIGGSIAIALAILHAFVTAGSTTVTGTIARTRVRAMLPNAPTIFALAAMFYYGIETLEGNGIELGLPTFVLAAIALLVAFGLRVLCAQLARFVQSIVRDFIALLSAQPAPVAVRSSQPHPRRAQIYLTARRLGRAPPNERRFR
jgi:hypothetical protein